MAKANRYFSKRGMKDIEIEFEDEKLQITVNIPTNYQHDKMMENHTELDAMGEVIVHGADLLEERLMRHLIALPFEVPYDDNMELFGDWDGANDDQKRVAVRLMESGLRDEINKGIAGEETLSDDEGGNSE